MPLDHEILVRLLEIQYNISWRLFALEDAGINAEVLRPDLLMVVLDAMGFPKEGDGDDTCRDEIWTRHMDTVKTGSREEIEEFLAWVRQLSHFNTLTEP